MEIGFIKGKEGKFVPKLVNFKWERKQGISKWPEKVVKDLGWRWGGGKESLERNFVCSQNWLTLE